MTICLDDHMSDKKKPTPRTRTIRISDDLLAMIQYLKFDADQHGERFKATEFLDEILRPVITEAFNRAQKRNKK